MNQNQERTTLPTWYVTTGDIDPAKIDFSQFRQRLPDFTIRVKSFLASGIRGDIVEDIAQAPWLTSYEKTLPITVYVDGSGLFRIANVSSYTRFIYLKSLHPKEQLRYDYSKAFIIMSMTEGNKALDDIRDAIGRGIQDAAEELHFPEIQCVRVDDQRGTTYKIDDMMIRHIEESGIIICDLTEEKPNCYFELGWALALKRKVIVTAKKGTRIHFDVSHLAIQFWESNWELEQKVKENTIVILNGIVR